MEAGQIGETEMSVTTHGGMQFDDHGNVLIPGNVARNRPPSHIRQHHVPGQPFYGNLFIHSRDDGSRRMTNSPTCTVRICGCR